MLIGVLDVSSPIGATWRALTGRRTARAVALVARRRRGLERAHFNVRERGTGDGNEANGVSGRAVGGGEGGIRTRDGLPRTAFPVRRHSPLGDLSRGADARPMRSDRGVWRRGRDSNPRCFRTPLFESGTINHSDTSPRERIPNRVRRAALAGRRVHRQRDDGCAVSGWRAAGRAPPPRRDGCR